MKKYIFFVLPVFMASQALAMNIAFMPGDAFFHALLTEESLADLSDEGMRFRYAHVPMSGGLCGYAGFENLQVTGDTSILNEHLRALYRSLREFYWKELRVNPDGTTTETNGFHVFIHNADVEWSSSPSSQRIGIKYNESWPNLPESAFQGESRKLWLGTQKALAT